MGVASAVHWERAPESPLFPTSIPTCRNGWELHTPAVALFDSDDGQFPSSSAYGHKQKEMVKGSTHRCVVVGDSVLDTVNEAVDPASTHKSMIFTSTPMLPSVP
jgi:hypothetical protein